MVVNIFSNFVLIIKIYAYIGIARMFTKSKKLDLLKDKTRLKTNVLMVMKLTVLAYFLRKTRWAAYFILFRMFHRFFFSSVLLIS